MLTSLHPGCTLGQVRNNTGWDIRVSSDLQRTDEPTSEELHIIREDLDAKHLYI
jgi:glutaconate CoA-transferase subunit B